MFDDRLTSEGDGHSAINKQSFHPAVIQRYGRVQETVHDTASDPQCDSPADISEDSHSSDTRYSQSITIEGFKALTEEKSAHHPEDLPLGLEGKVLVHCDSKAVTGRRRKSIIANTDDGIEGDEDEVDSNPVPERRSGADKRLQATKPGPDRSSRQDASRSPPLHDLVETSSGENADQPFRSTPVSPPSVTVHLSRPRTPSSTAVKRYPRDRQRSGNIQTRALAAPQPSTRNSANRVMQLTQADIRKQARERERRHIRDRAYMRFVPGLGLSSGATLAAFDQDSAYPDEQRRRPRSKSLGDSESQLSFFGGHGGQGPSKADWDEAAATVAAQVFRDAQDRVTSRPGPNKMPGFRASALPHFSLDTKFSLVLPKTAGQELSRFVSPFGSDSRGGRGEANAGDETPVIESVEFDLGLGKDLDNTIAQALKAAQQQASKVNAAKHVTVKACSQAAVSDNKVASAQDGQIRGIEGAKSPMLVADSVTVASGVVDEMPEMPLPAEAARVLSEARQAVVNCRASSSSTHKSKTGRKASMGMGLFKETAEVKTETSEARTKTTKNRTPTIEEENPLQQAKPADSRVSQVDKSKEHELLPQPRQQASEERPHLLGLPMGPRPAVSAANYESSCKVGFGSVTPTRERERSRLLAHYLTTTSSKPIAGQRDASKFESSPHRSLGISPLASRQTSRAASPTVQDSQDDHFGWSSGASWETSSGISSSEESDDCDDHIEEDHPTSTLGETLRQHRKHLDADSFSDSHGSQDGLARDQQHQRNADIRSDSGARHWNQAGGEMTIPLQPFNNKVGGHSEIYKFTRRAVCKVSISLSFLNVAQLITSTLVMRSPPISLSLIASRLAGKSIL